MPVAFPTTIVDEETGDDKDTVLDLEGGLEWPYWENVICTLRYRSENAQREGRFGTEEEPAPGLGNPDTAEVPDLVFDETCGF